VGEIAGLSGDAEGATPRKLSGKRTTFHRDIWREAICDQHRFAHRRGNVRISRQVIRNKSSQVPRQMGLEATALAP